MTHEESGRNEFGQELRRLREQAGLTQVQLAARLGYHHSYVSKIESGAREPRITFADKADDLLVARGSLLAVATRIRARPCAGPVVSAGEASVPLPRAPHGADQPRPSLTRYVRLPAFGVICPSHGINGCVVPVPGDLAEVPGVDGLTVGAETLHGFAALLTTFHDADISEVAGDLAIPVERALRTLMTLVPMARGAHANGLLQLAARYADLAGWLRVKRGQHGIAMAWLHRSVEWALASGGVATACEALSSMGVLAMIEGDAATALDYSGAAAAVDPNRLWMGVHAQLNQARAHAMLGDHREFARLSSAAQRAVDQFDDRDRIEAPWLTGASGATYIASHLAGGLRDLAEVTGRSVIADRAVMHAETSLANVPARMHGSRLMLTLRLADSHACRGDLDAAVELTRPVIAAVTSTPATPIRHELSRLRTRLGSRFAELLDSI